MSTWRYLVDSPQEVPGHVALLAAGIARPPPLVLGVVALAQHDQRLVHVEGQLIAVLGLVGEDGVHVAIVQDAQFLLNACKVIGDLVGIFI